MKTGDCHLPVECWLRPEGELALGSRLMIRSKCTLQFRNAGRTGDGKFTCLIRFAGVFLFTAAYIYLLGMLQVANLRERANF